jgi:mono/diheme cytochrome c family protein
MRAQVGLGLAVAALLASAPAGAQTAVERGQTKFELSCAPCHGAGAGDDGRAMLPGTEALQIKYRGQVPAVLEQRTDLTAEVLAVFVRRGTWSMPPFRKTELTDAEIADIAAYLAVTSKRGPAAPR